MKRYLIRLLTGKWEEVTEHVYNVRKFVVDPTTNLPKYGDQTIVVEGTEFTINGKVSADELGKLCRYLSVNIPMGTYSSIVSEPETVQINRGNSIKLHVLKTGENWTKTITKKAA